MLLCFKIDWLDKKKNWKNLNTIGIIISERDAGDKISKDARYFICCIPQDAKLFATSVRVHWGIENKIHWVLDIAFREKGLLRQVVTHSSIVVLKSNKGVCHGYVDDTTNPDMAV
ncbi:MAG: ISAs1 family transposase [Desulfotignum sp.]|nr:ISAs1 family transposase [Desulfotignum sp.]